MSLCDQKPYTPKEFNYERYGIKKYQNNSNSLKYCIQEYQKSNFQNYQISNYHKQNQQNPQSNDFMRQRSSQYESSCEDYPSNKALRLFERNCYQHPDTSSNKPKKPSLNLYQTIHANSMNENYQDDIIQKSCHLDKCVNNCESYCYQPYKNADLMNGNKIDQVKYFPKPRFLPNNIYGNTTNNYDFNYDQKSNTKFSYEADSNNSKKISIYPSSNYNHFNSYNNNFNDNYNYNDSYKYNNNYSYKYNYNYNNNYNYKNNNKVDISKKDKTSTLNTTVYSKGNKEKVDSNYYFNCNSSQKDTKKSESIFKSNIYNHNLTTISNNFESKELNYQPPKNSQNNEKIKKRSFSENNAHKEKAKEKEKSLFTTFCLTKNEKIVNNKEAGNKKPQNINNCLNTNDYVKERDTKKSIINSKKSTGNIKEKENLISQPNNEDKPLYNKRTFSKNNKNYHTSVKIDNENLDNEKEKIKPTVNTNKHINNNNKNSKLNDNKNGSTIQKKEKNIETSSQAQNKNSKQSAKTNSNKSQKPSVNTVQKSKNNKKICLDPSSSVVSELSSPIASASSLSKNKRT